MKIRIINSPPGDVPDYVRQAWIGLEIPVSPEMARKGYVIGSTSGRKGLLGGLIAFLNFGLRRGRKCEGYFVDSKSAIELLASHSPEAVAWFKQNRPQVFEPGQKLMFTTDCIEKLDDAAR